MEIDYPPHLPQSPETIAWNAAHPDDLLFSFYVGQKPAPAKRHINCDRTIGAWVEVKKGSFHRAVGPNCYTGPWTTVYDNAQLIGETVLSGQASVSGVARVNSCELTDNVIVKATSRGKGQPPPEMYQTKMSGSAMVLDFEQIRHSVFKDEVRVYEGQAITILNCELSGNAEVTSSRRPAYVQDVTMLGRTRVIGSHLAYIDLSGNIVIEESTISGHEKNRTHLSGDFKVIHTEFSIPIVARDQITFEEQVYSWAGSAKTVRLNSGVDSLSMRPAAMRAQLSREATWGNELDQGFAEWKKTHGGR